MLFAKCYAQCFAFALPQLEDKPFSVKRFICTIAIQTLATLGLAVTGISGDVYTSAVGPTAVTVFVQKIWDSIAKQAQNR